MKAKDYAKKYNDSPTNETLAEIANCFIHEVESLIETRHAKSNSACMAILKELDQKWVAFSNLVPDVRRNGFRLIVREVFPALIEPIGWGNLTMRAIDPPSALVGRGDSTNTAGN